MATAGNQGGGQTGWREGKSVESVWGPCSFGVQDLGDSRDKMKHIMSRVTEYARTVIK